MRQGTGIFDNLDRDGIDKLSEIENTTTPSLKLCCNINPKGDVPVAELLVVWSVRDTVIRIVKGIIPPNKRDNTVKHGRVFIRKKDGTAIQPRRLRRGEFSILSYLDFCHISATGEKGAVYRILRAYAPKDGQENPVIKVFRWGTPSEEHGSRIVRAALKFDHGYQSFPAFELDEQDWFNREVLKCFGKFACGQPAPVTSMLRYRLYRSWACGDYEALTQGTLFRLFKMDNPDCWNSDEVEEENLETVAETVSKEPEKKPEFILSRDEFRKLREAVSTLSSDEVMELLDNSPYAPSEGTELKNPHGFLIKAVKMERKPKAVFSINDAILAKAEKPKQKEGFLKTIPR